MKLNKKNIKLNTNKINAKKITAKKNTEETQSCKTCSTDLVDIRSDAFAFCRYGVMIIVWLALLLQLKWLVLLSFGILLLSAIFGIGYAPMILIYTNTIGLFFKFKTEKLGVSGMRFAHTLGSIFAGIAVLCLYFWNTKVGWVIVIFLAIMKTISAIGLCPAYKLYNCIKSGGCCSFTRKLSK
ncbi:MAG: DUF4395 family protein [Candidatus Woesearchaeota archaeon]|jgi:hypothetical protein